MDIPIDIHTHRRPAIPDEAIVNCFLPTAGEEALPIPVAGWYSVGIHPWHIAGQVQTLRLPEDDARLLAIGEAGLDKLASTPLPLQMELFEQQARLAGQLGKPLVIHLVRAVDELLQLKRKLKPAVPWIIHGFRGNATLAGEYLRHGFYLSFGEKYREEALRIVPVDRLFMETDESAVPIRELYARAACVRGVSAGELLQSVRENVRCLFFGR